MEAGGGERTGKENVGVAHDQVQVRRNLGPSLVFWCLRLVGTRQGPQIVRLVVRREGTSVEAIREGIRRLVAVALAQAGEDQGSDPERG